MRRSGRSRTWPRGEAAGFRSAFAPFGGPPTSVTWVGEARQARCLSDGAGFRRPPTTGRAGQGPAALFRKFTGIWEGILVSSDFYAGCPVVAVAVASTEDSGELVQETAKIFDRRRDALTSAFEEEGFGHSDAAELGTMSVASLEGAVVLCRSLRSIEPLKEVSAQLEYLIDSRRPVSSGQAA